MVRLRFLSNVAWAKLSSNQKSDRLLALDILGRMKKGLSLTASSKEVGLSKEVSLKHLGRAVYKKSGRWTVSKSNSIQREMKIYENGRIKSIIVRNSRDASLIGEYFNEVRNFLETGDTSGLKRFSRRAIIDANDRKHTLETRPEKIREIDDSKEDSEFFEIYENG